MEDVIVRLMDLPVPGVTVLDSDGNYNVYINARLSYEERKKTLAHELRHIKNDHFFDDRAVTIIEKEAG